MCFLAAPRWKIVFVTVIVISLCALPASSSSIIFHPSTSLWGHACYTGATSVDSVTCTVSSWRDDRITLSGFRGDYGQRRWIVNKHDDFIVQAWNPQTHQEPGTCTVVADDTTTMQCNCIPDYCIPTPVAYWNTQYADTSTPGVEPLNVIISARSDVPLDAILAGLKHGYGWNTVRTGVPCLSAEKANVTGDGFVDQQQSWRLQGCKEGLQLSYHGKEDHVRLWNQPVPDSQFGAWFIAASYETLCVKIDGKWEPTWPDHMKYLLSSWHCIDGGPGSYDKSGYDNGATNLVAQLIQVAHASHWDIKTRIDTRPAGVGEDTVAFSGAVFVVTINQATA